MNCSATGMFRTAWVSIAATIALCGPTWCFGQATQITYTIDPTQSVLTGSGTYFGEPLQTITILNGVDPSPTGSNILYSGFTVSYAGTITADRDTLADTLTITGGNVAAQDNSFLDTLDIPNAPTAKNYEFGLNTFPANSNDFLFQGVIANFSFSVSSPLINSPTAFDASQLTSNIASGQFFGVQDTLEGLGGGLEQGASYDFSAPVLGNLAFASGSGSLIDFGGVETLTIPINTDVIIQANGEPLDLNLSGEIVATTAIPEPGSLGLLAASGLLLLRRRQLHGVNDGGIRPHPRFVPV